MAEHIHKCSVCGKYTMDNICSSCAVSTLIPRPPKFSLEDKYADYKRKVKKEELARQGWY